MDYSLLIPASAKKQLQKIIDNHKSEDGELPSEWYDMFDEHYTGTSSDYSQLPLVYYAMLLGHYSKYLQVPTRYKIAYRAMTSISRRHMSEFLKIPANSIPNSGITNGGNYKPLNAGHGSSWTVKPQLFVSKAFLKNVGIMPSNPDSYTVIMEANIHQVPPVFIGNPDKLGGVYFDNSEKEVIGYDKIPLHRVAFLRNTDTNVYLTSQKALEAKVKADLSTVLALLS
jgi:hypothetical protein